MSSLLHQLGISTTLASRAPVGRQLRSLCCDPVRQLPGLTLACSPWTPSPGAQGCEVRVGYGPHCDLWNHTEPEGPPYQVPIWAPSLGEAVSPLRARQPLCVSTASVAGPAGAEAEKEAPGAPDGAGQCRRAAPEPAGPAVGGAGPPGGVLPQRQHQLPRYTPPRGCSRGPWGLPADLDRRGPVLWGVPRWAEGWDRRREAGIWSLG